MKIVKTASGNEINISKSEWKSIGKTAGWIKESDEEENIDATDPTAPVDEYNPATGDPEEWVTFSYGKTPEEVINARARATSPNGYDMQIRSQEEWATLVTVVNQGIDSHLEGFTKSVFDSSTGNCTIAPDEMKVLLRRLYEEGSEDSWSLRTDILSTLNIEEV